MTTVLNVILSTLIFVTDLISPVMTFSKKSYPMNTTERVTNTHHLVKLYI